MTDFTLNDGDKAYSPASATDVQKTWHRVTGWESPSKDPQIVAKWDYFKSITLRSELSLQAGEKK